MLCMCLCLHMHYLCVCTHYLSLARVVLFIFTIVDWLPPFFRLQISWELSLCLKVSCCIILVLTHGKKFNNHRRNCLQLSNQKSTQKSYFPFSSCSQITVIYNTFTSMYADLPHAEKCQKHHSSDAVVDILPLTTRRECSNSLEERAGFATFQLIHLMWTFHLIDENQCLLLMSKLTSR